MSRVSGIDTKPEVFVRKLLTKSGLRYRLHIAELPGKPDIAVAKSKKAVFVNGCFWHGHVGCRRSERPESNSNFWQKKLTGNVMRDRRNVLNLKKMGWEVMVIWECEIKSAKAERLTRKLSRFFERKITVNQ